MITICWVALSAISAIIIVVGTNRSMTEDEMLESWGHIWFKDARIKYDNVLCVWRWEHINNSYDSDACGLGESVEECKRQVLDYLREKKAYATL